MNKVNFKHYHICFPSTPPSAYISFTQYKYHVCSHSAVYTVSVSTTQKANNVIVVLDLSL